MEYGVQSFKERASGVVTQVFNFNAQLKVLVLTINVTTNRKVNILVTSKNRRFIKKGKSSYARTDPSLV